MYALPVDAPLKMQWREAKAYAAALDAHGHKDWRLPSKDELDDLYRNREKGALRGTFSCASVPDYSSAYWSSTSYHDDTRYAWMKTFSDGFRYFCRMHSKHSARPVRSDPPPPKPPSKLWSILNPWRR